MAIPKVKKELKSYTHKGQNVVFYLDAEGKRNVAIGDIWEEGIVATSNSKHNTLARCEKVYDYKYWQKLRPKRKKKPLWKGDITHQCLEAMYSDKNWKQVIKDFREEFNKLFEEERMEYGDLPNEVAAYMKGYERTYKGDPNWRVLEVEFNFYLRIPKTNIVLTGVIDLVVEDIKTGFVWIVEHKTTKKAPNINAKVTDLQTALYYFVGKCMGYEVKGVILNYIRTKAPTEPRLLQRGGLSKAKDIDTDFYTYAKAIKDNGLDPKDYVEVLTRLKTEPNRFYIRHTLRKPTTLVKSLLVEMIEGANRMEKLKIPLRSFSFLCERQCDYYPICVSEIQGLDTEYIIKHDYEKREDEDGEEEGERENEA